MQKKLIGYTVLMGLGLGLAFYASVDTQKDKDLGQVWDDVAADKIVSVDYVVTAPQRKVVVQRIPNNKGFWVSFKSEDKVSPPAPEAGVDPTQAPPPTPETKVVEESFRADNKMAQFFDSFKPLRAERVVGDDKDIKLADFGIGADSPTLTLNLEGGKKLVYRIGQKSYGSSNVFVHDPERKKVILINGMQIENLADARSRMYERNMFEFDANDVKKAEIATDSLQAKWDQSERDDKGVLQWKEDREGSSPKASYKTWMDKVLKVKLQRYATETERSQVEAAPVVMSITFLDTRGPTDKLEFRKTSGIDPESKGTDEYWVTSKFLGIPARIPTVRIEPIIKELPTLLGKN